MPDSNIIVYTAIFGNYDTPYRPLYSSSIHHFCVTDTYSTATNGYIPLIMPSQGSCRLSSRFYKINSHLTFPGTEFTIWHGGNVQLRQSPEVLIDFLGDSDIAAIRHPQRTCIYHEADACIDWKKDDPDIIRKQMSRYHNLGYPSHNGLHTAFLIIRRNCDAIMDLNRMWWEEVRNGSVRDQLSFDYVCWELGIKVKDIPGDIYSGKFYKRYAIHKGEKK